MGTAAWKIGSSPDSIGRPGEQDAIHRNCRFTENEQMTRYLMKLLLALTATLFVARTFAADANEAAIRKAAANLNKHGVPFSDAALALEDPHALIITDPDAIDESRFICLGADPSGRILITVFAPRGRAIRIMSSQKASRSERRPYEKVR